MNTCIPVKDVMDILREDQETYCDWWEAQDMRQEQEREVNNADCGGSCEECSRKTQINCEEVC